MVERFLDKLIAWSKRLKRSYLAWRVKLKIQRNGPESPRAQDLDIYSTPSFGDLVSTWGEQTAWKEIEYLLVNCKGKVLDMACGTCVIFPKLSKFEYCDLYGCDISRYLIERAVQAGLPSSKLTACDATKTPYGDDFFDHAYSIGSLEHFTEEGISAFLNESRRIARYSTFHQIPVSRSNRDEGWIKLGQSYFNNSVDWWLNKFKAVYPKVYILDSEWEDPISVGKWFVCFKSEGNGWKN